MNHPQANQKQEPAQTSSKAMLKAKKPSGDARMPENNALFTAEDLISSYSRAQALEDGQLVDVTATAREAGFKIPVALTRAVWVDCVEWLESDEARKATTQDESGRLWDVLWMAFLAARSGASGSRVTFEVLRVPREGRGNRPTPVSLVMTIGPGDDPAPVITIMQPNKD